MMPDDLFNSRRFRAVYGQGVFGQNVQPAPTTPAREPGATNTCQTWTEAQVLRLARLDSDRPIAANAAGNV